VLPSGDNLVASNMEQETHSTSSEQAKTCQNCKKEFTIEPEDFLFYDKIKVPPPTWCPQCRMIRRLVFYSQRKLFRQKDAATGKQIFSNYHPQASVKVYDRDYWWSDQWDPVDYGKDYDFSRPFFEQFRELQEVVPLPNLNVHQLVNSDYANNAGFLKNCYLCFDTGESENSAYLVRGIKVKESLDLYEALDTELSYENNMVDKVYRAFFSMNCEKSSDIWFSRNLSGCSNCFGCVNLRGKSYYIFNEPHTKESYEEFIKNFNSGSYRDLRAMRTKASDFWKKFPVKYSLSVNTENSIGEHIERSKNLKYCYSVHESENIAFSQFVDPPATDSYDLSDCFRGVSNMYETVCGGFDSYGVKFSWQCWLSNNNIEYSAVCHSSSDLFGCVSLQKKQYCILNKQYSKDAYFEMREKIIQHMKDMPYVDSKGWVYKYGEFFPPEFSPSAYNETIAQDFFPLSKEQAEQQGFLWRDPETQEYQTTIAAKELPDHSKDVGESILEELIKCLSCERAYRIIASELAFYRTLKLPLPRLCPDCRFQERLKCVNSPQWRHAQCQCAGTNDERGIYQNTTAHTHGTQHCSREFETSFAKDRQEIIYCEDCYQTEVV